MLEANKTAWFEKIFTIYNHNLFKRRFNSFKVSGTENLSLRNKNIPTIVYCNHSSWWDGLVAYHVSRNLKLDSYVMMEEKQLKNLNLFRRLGAFSVVRENPREAIKSINYSVSVLKQKSDRAVWIFPQGEILPNNLRPVKFFNGVSRIIEKVKKCQVICAVIRYEFLGKYKPDIFVKIDEPIIFSNLKRQETKGTTQELAEIMEENLDGLRNLITSQDLDSFTNII